MFDLKSLVASLRKNLGAPVATPETDPERAFYATLQILPNPDPILREIGRAEQVYNSILTDAHVIGDVRSIRGEFRSYEYRVVAGDEQDARSVAARDLCDAWLAACRPNPVCDWLEVMWQMTSAILSGYRAHELVWQLNRSDNPALRGKLLPDLVLDRPDRRFRFSAHAAPLLISKSAWAGEAVEPYQFIISRHMPTATNPYGRALLSSCFWTWTFKTGGWRIFFKHCERHGLPWAIGRYPLGTPEPDQDALAAALGNMLEAAYAVVPDGTGVELLETKATGTALPQESLINACNREMSKALTGQAMVAELHNVGARAASEVALKRQSSINDADRDIAAGSMSQLFEWVTLFNFGADVSPPRLEFFRREAADLDRVRSYEAVARLGGRPSIAALMEEMNIPEARDDADLVKPAAVPGPTDPAQGQSPTGDGSAFASGAARRVYAAGAQLDDASALDLAARAADQAIETHMLRPIADMLAQYEQDGRTLADFMADLGKHLGVMDPAALREVTQSALEYSIVAGAATKAD